MQLCCYWKALTAETDYKLLHFLLLKKNLCSPGRTLVRQMTSNPVVDSLLTLYHYMCMNHLPY